MARTQILGGFGKSSIISSIAAALGISPTVHPRSWKYNTDPRAARHCHNPADPVQAARIEAAAARREERAEHRIYCAARSRNNNHAHIVQHREPDSTSVRFEFLARFNPFHVAH